MKEYNKPTIISSLWPGLYGDDLSEMTYTVLSGTLNSSIPYLMETIPSPRLGFLRGVFLANHLASTDNLTRTTKRQNIQQRKLTIHKNGP